MVDISATTQNVKQMLYHCIVKTYKTSLNAKEKKIICGVFMAIFEESVVFLETVQTSLQT